MGVYFKIKKVMEILKNYFKQRQQNQEKLPVQHYLIVRVSLFNKMKNIVNLKKTEIFFGNEAPCVCTTVQKRFALRMSIAILYFHIVSHRFRKKKTVP